MSRSILTKNYVVQYNSRRTWSGHDLFGCTYRRTLSLSSWPTRIQLETRSSTAHYSAWPVWSRRGLHGGSEDADCIHEGEVQPA